MLSKQGMHKVCSCSRRVRDSISEGVFAMVLVDEIALAEGAASQKLDGIHPTHVGFDDGHEICSWGNLQAMGFPPY
jgi:hypothetical protein